MSYTEYDTSGNSNLLFHVVANTGWVKKNVPKIHFRITKVKRKF